MKPIEEMYDKVKSSANGLFNKMAELIESCNEKLNEIIDKIKKLEYSSINLILTTFKSEYMNFIQIKDKLIAAFYDVGNTFLNEIKNLVSNL